MANILVVDDDKITLQIISAALTSVGHTVQTCEDGYQAIEALERELFHMMITDVSMPMVSGYNLVTTIRKQPKFENLPIIFVTGRRDKADVVRALKAGGDDYVVKPIDNQIFFGKVESLLQNKKGAHSFSETSISYAAKWTADFRITGISEQGLTLTTSALVPVNFKLQIETDLFDEIEISTPTLRVVSCEPTPEDKKISLVRANFIGLTEGEFQAIRKWTMNRRISKGA